MNNPIGLVDPDGRWPWIANLKSWVSALTGSNPWHFPSSDEGKQISYSNKESLDIDRIQNTLCSFVGKWSDKSDKNYSPKLSSYLKGTSVPVGLADNVLGLESNGNIVLEKSLTEKNNTPILEIVFAHELSHALYPGEGEFGAYSVQYSMGGISESKLEEYFDGNTIPLTDEQKKLRKEGSLFKTMKEKGEELRGKNK